MFGIEVFYELRTDACSAANDVNSLYQCLATWGIIKSIKREDRAASCSPTYPFIPHPSSTIGNLAERSKARDSSLVLNTCSRFIYCVFTYRKMRGFESLSSHHFCFVRLVVVDVIVRPGAEFCWCGCRDADGWVGGVECPSLSGKNF